MTGEYGGEDWAFERAWEELQFCHKHNLHYILPFNCPMCEDYIEEADNGL